MTASVTPPIAIPLPISLAPSFVDRSLTPFLTICPTVAGASALIPGIFERTANTKNSSDAAAAADDDASPALISAGSLISPSWTWRSTCWPINEGVPAAIPAIDEPHSSAVPPAAAIPAAGRPYRTAAAVPPITSMSDRLSAAVCGKTSVQNVPIAPKWSPLSH